MGSSAPAHSEDLRAVHVEVTGEPVRAVVALCSGLGGLASDWRPVTRLLEPGIAGVAFELTPGGRPLAECVAAVEDIRLRYSAGLPFVLVGHSMAGMTVEAYARTHPTLLAGAVLVDPSPEPPGSTAVDDPLTKAVRVLLRRGAVPPGLARRLGPALRSLMMTFGTLSEPDPDPVATRARFADSGLLTEILAEFASYPDRIRELEKMRARSRTVPPIPWTVLTAASAMGGGRSAARLLAAHADLAAVSPIGGHEIVGGAGHLLGVDRPDVVASAVREVVRARMMLA
ncbi:alpha/beta hydrolase [Allokutzneria sp. A3M-2-11 16]|uniref:alpha/beta hydrolase n=1 Tax=Allokutzneria sp. A3M-2-11 16 TaxID=2962043 RepID=UPI0020B6A8E5|nr:alpha/beta hydrolase [Allokutzneria sp. A3M-2-11 16]MCP3803664.1 alpha/beta hydrolase [Allokutzneria sp. A3M-2-11 16]